MLGKVPEYMSPEKTSGSMANPSEPNRSRTYRPNEPHITESPITKANWYKHVNWLNVTLIVGIPLYGCIQAIWTTLQWKTALWAIAYYYMTGLGITAALVGGGAVEGSVRWWARDHRAHHRYTDTDKDPYSVRKGLLYSYDPTKWSIWIWKQLGLAYDLKQFKQNEIEKGRVQQQQKKLDQKRSKLDWGVPLHTLPVMEWDDFQDQANNGRGLIAVAGIVHDVTEFIKDHPGGKAMIKSGLGKDATAMFNGGIYMHSNAAHNLLSTMRVGVIRGGCEVDIWKRAHKDGQHVEDDQSQRIVRAGYQVTKIRESLALPGAA
ncbi:MAG: hypothetical protein Q9225_006504 [Loekoesia sp. 1 TL-2023]